MTPIAVYNVTAAREDVKTYVETNHDQTSMGIWCRDGRGVLLIASVESIQLTMTPVYSITHLQHQVILLHGYTIPYT